MKKIVTSTITAGVAYPPSKKGFDFLQQSYQQILAALAQSIGGESVTGTEAYTLYGCVKTSLGGSNYSFTEGYIYDAVTEEVYYFPAVASIAIATAPVLTITTTADPTADPTTFTDGSIQNVHDVRTLVVSDGALGSADINYADLVFVQSDRLLTKIVNIGDWNMDTTVSVNVTHGVTASKIRGVKVIILPDTGTSIYPLDQMDGAFAVNGGIPIITSTYVQLERVTGGAFDNATFDATSFNRGYVTIDYIL